MARLEPPQVLFNQELLVAMIIWWWAPLYQRSSCLGIGVKLWDLEAME